jgi:SAM-dependent methyltransferase
MTSHSPSAAASPIDYVLRGRRAIGPDPGRPWRVWDLDAELRYVPVVDALPASDLPICEVGSGPRGVAVWTGRSVIGVDPGADEEHGDVAPPSNMRRVAGDGAAIPLADGTAGATIAVDTFEHIPRAARGTVIAEMARVTAPGGRVVAMGPTGAPAAGGDRRVLNRWRQREDGANIVRWISEHEELGLPTVDELTGHMAASGLVDVRAQGVFNLRLWYTMHRALLGDFPQPPGDHRLHHLAWLPFATVARHLRRGPYYRYLVTGDVRRT